MTVLLVLVLMLSMSLLSFGSMKYKIYHTVFVISASCAPILLFSYTFSHTFSYTLILILIAASDTSRYAFFALNTGTIRTHKLLVNSDGGIMSGELSLKIIPQPTPLFFFYEDYFRERSSDAAT